MTGPELRRRAREVELRRLARAVHLDVERLDLAVWRVRGGAESHVVKRSSLGALTCDCADAVMRKALCKHVLSVQLYAGDRDTIRALRSIVSVPRGEPSTSTANADDAERQRIATFPFGRRA